MGNTWALTTRGMSPVEPLNLIKAAIMFICCNYFSD